MVHLQRVPQSYVRKLIQPKNTLQTQRPAPATIEEYIYGHVWARVMAKNPYQRQTRIGWRYVLEVAEDGEHQMVQIACTWLLDNCRGGSWIPCRRGRQHMILSKFPKNCMKSRQFWTVGGRAPRTPPLGSTTELVVFEPLSQALGLITSWNSEVFMLTS